MGQRAKDFQGNRVSYKGWVSKPPKLTKKGDTFFLDYVIAEEFQVKNSKAPNELKDPNKGPDDYVRYSVAWHRLTIMGDKALEYAQDPALGKGALLYVHEASYREAYKPWTNDKGLTLVSREETIGDRQGEIEAHFDSKEEEPAWDGLAEVEERKFERTGGGSGPEDLMGGGGF